MKKLLFLLPCCCGIVWGQVPTVPAIQHYIGTIPVSQFDSWNKDPKSRVATSPGGISVNMLLPTANPFQFVRYIQETQAAAVAAASSAAAQQSISQGLASSQAQASQSQVNKMLGSTVGSSGGTSLLSSSAVTDFLGIATEYGAITQAASGDVTTFSGNLVGLAGLYRGDPYWGCASVAANIDCGGAKRLLRGFSGTISMETGNSGTSAVTGTNAATGTAATANIPAGKERMSSWGVRFDWNHKTLYDVTEAAFKKAMSDKAVTGSATEQELDAAMPALFARFPKTWREDFVNALNDAPAGQLEAVLQARLDALIATMASDTQFMASVVRARNAVLASFAQRDKLLEGLQRNKFSTEFNSLHPLGQPNLSNMRLIYSYQKAAQATATSTTNLSPLLLTVNAAAEWYDSVPGGVKVSRMRDLQLAAQVDESISGAANSVLTFGFYYQWMKDDALITIPAGMTAPGTEITLPGAASTLLATKGSIDIFQAKWTLPLKSGVIKVPVSFTWANRTELINEQEKKGEIGLTLDLDSVFQK